jgi:trimethylamine:corrinoid methyltransferase-like protein
MEWLGKEIFNPSDLVDRQELSAWKKLGSKDTVQRAREITHKILRDHKPEPLSTDIEKSLDDVARKIMKRYGVDKLPLGPA